MLYRDSRLFACALCNALVMGILFLAACAGLFWVITASEAGSDHLVEIAVSNEDAENSFGEMAIRLASSHDLVSKLVTIRLCDTSDEAIKAVEDGAAAAVILPDGFFDSIMSGEDLPCRLVLSKTNTSGRNTVAAYAEVGSDLLSAAQYAVYAGTAYLKSQGISDQALSDYIYQLDLDSFSHVSEAQKLYFETSEIPYTAGGLSMYCHYAVLYASFCFCILILSFSHLYNADCRRDRLIRLQASAISEAQFIRWKLLLPCLFVLLLAGGMLCAAVPFFDVQFSLGAVACAVCAVAFCTAFGGLLSLGLGTLGGCAQFLCTIAGLFLLGGIIPYSRMNPIAITMGAYTPLGVVYGLFSPLFGGTLSWSLFPTGAVYLAAAFLLAHFRIARIIEGRNPL